MIAVKENLLYFPGVKPLEQEVKEQHAILKEYNKNAWIAKNAGEAISAIESLVCRYKSGIVLSVIQAASGVSFDVETRTAYIDMYQPMSKPFPLPVNLDKTLRIIANIGDEWKIVIGKNCESFLLMDRKYRQTFAVLKYLKNKNHSIEIFTESDLVSCDDYLGLLKKGCLVKMYTGEEGHSTPSIKRREKAIEKLRGAGIFSAALPGKGFYDSMDKK